MKLYQMLIIDLDRNILLGTRHTVGLSNARKLCPVKLHWCNNAKSWWGFNGNIQYIVKER